MSLVEIDNKPVPFPQNIIVAILALGTIFFSMIFALGTILVVFLAVTAPVWILVLLGIFLGKIM